jgi:hypothetical protein
MTKEEFIQIIQDYADWLNSFIERPSAFYKLAKRQPKYSQLKWLRGFVTNRIKSKKKKIR